MILTMPTAVGGYYEFDDMWHKEIGIFMNNHKDHALVLTELGGGVIFKLTEGRFVLMMRETPSYKELCSWMWQRVEFST